jgi:MFS family permease
MHMTMETGPARVNGVYYGWYIVVICVLTQVCANALPVNAFSLFLRPWSTEMHTPVSTFLLAIGSMGSVCAFIAPLAGAMADKYPARRMLGIGVVILAIGFLAISFAHAPWQILASYAVILPVAVLMTTSIVTNSVISRWFVRRLGLALGISGFGLAAGGVLLPPLVAALLETFSWRSIWQGGAALVICVVLPLTLLVIRDQPTEREGFHYLSGDGGAPVHSHHGRGGGETMGWGKVLSSRNFWIIIIAYLPMLALYGAVMQNVAPIAATRGFSERTAGMLMSVLSIGQLTATLGGGAISDRIGNRLPLIGLGLICALGGAICAFGTSVPLMVVGVFLVAAGGSFWPVVTAALASEFGAANVGRAFGAVSFFLPLGVLAPFSVAKAQELTGSYVPSLMAMIALTLLGAFACLFMREKPRANVTLGEPAIA